MITKDLCTYSIKILRQEKTLRDHRAGRFTPVSPTPPVPGHFLLERLAVARRARKEEQERIDD
jgi:hypothetical protein